MNESWDTTQSRLRKWQREHTTAWELRRILSDSAHFRLIAMCSAQRADNRPAGMGWQDWWGFYLERLTERDAVKLLLDTWNKDIWGHLQREARASSRELLSRALEQSRLAEELASALEGFLEEPPRPASAGASLRPSPIIDGAQKPAKGSSEAS